MDVAELARQIEYKVAPEPLIAVQGLANTFAYDTSEERLESPEGARRWLIESGLTTPEVEVGPPELDRLRGLRTRIRELIDANLSEEEGSGAAAAAALARLAADHPLPLVADPDGGLRLDLEPTASVDALVAQLIGIVFQAQLAGEWPRLKICAFDECRWSFYDASRNRGGTWCQMDVCGNRVKNRAYRQRRARSS